MRCSKCGAENPEGVKFCNECASPFKRRCAKCGFDNPPTAKFCGECAAPLTDSDSAPDRSHAPAQAVRFTPETDSQAVGDGERKMVTALFADIKGSMELMEDIDPEDARAIVDPALKLMMDAAQHYGGYIVQSTGDGIFALFGAPVAHEDHPQRALYAALRMQDEMQRYGDRMRQHGQAPLQVRVGVNSGDVVVRTIKTGESHTEYTPIGHSTSLASRLQTLATPGSTVISEQTRKFVEGYFSLKPLGPARIKGVSEPVNVFEVTGLGPLRTRLQRSAGRGLTKFVGRQREMEAMKHVAEQAKAGRGQIVAAMAEPGVGKSRLFYEFKVKNQSGWMVLEAFSLSHGKASAFLPVLDLLWSYFEIGSDDDERKRREKINGKIVTLDRSLEDALPYLYGLLGLTDENNEIAEIEAQTRKRRSLDAIKRILLRESLNQPLMIIFEDLHWVDEETQAFLKLLADSIGTARILLMVNYRPEYRHEWGQKTYYTQLRLDPLGEESADEMLNALLGDGAELGALKRLIIERTEGNPFFMEETVLVLLDEGALVRNGVVKLTRPLNQLKIPPTVQAILAARIDRLAPEEKDLLQTLAVLGKEFPLGLIREVVGKPDNQLQRMLSELQLGEFVYEQPAFPDVEYTFKHALTQEVAYNSLLIERRKALHERTAGAIETLFRTQLDDHLGELAHHYARSANTAQAVKYLHLAAEQALQRSAHEEASSLIATALELLAAMPRTPERILRELELELAQGAAMRGAYGPAAPQVEETLIRARELSREVGETPLFFAVLGGLFAFHLLRGQLQPAVEVAQQLLAQAERTQDPSLLVLGLRSRGSVLWRLGELTRSRDDLERALALYNPDRDRFHCTLSGLDSGVNALGELAFALSRLGYLDQALSRNNAAVALSRKVSHLVSLAYSLLVSGYTCCERGDWHLARERAEEALKVSTEGGFAQFTAASKAVKGWALAGLGEQEGLVLVQQSLEELRALGSEWICRMIRSVMAEFYGRLGKPEEGLALIASLPPDEAESPDIVRTHGELLLGLAAPDERRAESLFRAALCAAKKQGARLWELRAAVSLARLLARTERRDEARAILAEIYHWFTEGFDTADLKDAKALLDELSKREP